MLRNWFIVVYILLVIECCFGVDIKAARTCCNRVANNCDRVTIVFSTEAERAWLKQHRGEAFIVGGRRIKWARGKRRIVPFSHRFKGDPGHLYSVILFSSKRQQRELVRDHLRCHRMRVARFVAKRARIMGRPIHILVQNNNVPKCNDTRSHISLTVPLGSSVKLIKEEAMLQFGLNKQRCILWAEMKRVLDDSKTLYDYGITNGATLQISSLGLISGSPETTDNPEQEAESVRREKSSQNRERNRERKRRSKKRKKEDTEREERSKYGESLFASVKEKQDSMRSFEKGTENLINGHCKVCRRVGIGLKIIKRGKNSRKCKKCRNLPDHFYLDQKLLPVWYNKKREPQYRVPDELSNLTDAEKMLIQKASVFVPLHHIKHGTLGLKGHSCCFPQDLKKMCIDLPRLPEEVKIVKFVQRYRDTMGGEGTSKAFRVRKVRVLAALNWLKEHHSDYADIQIRPSKLDWMGKSSVLDLPTAFETTTIADEEEVCRNTHLCPI